MKVGCFNIQNISENKIKKNKNVVNQIATIISNYDIMFILELSDNPSKNCKDTHSPVLELIVATLNKNENELYTYHANKKQGLTASYAERVGIIYKNNKQIIDINFNELTEINNIDEKYKFARNPYIIPINIYKDQYIFMICHIQLNEVNNELSLLNDVFNDLYIKNENENKKFVLMGDYNADGSYLSNNNELNNPLFTNKNLLCLTNNELTNLSKNKCYDRVLCSTNCLVKLNPVDNDQGNNAYCDVDYLEYLKLNKEQIKKISDHYPVFIEIKDINTKKEN